ncbi:hypothetical protein MsAm2_03890 [Methanolapillus ohkumae]|uniref:PD-(D/E)XK motif protein n=2 Tax=Methanolapillus ohkumae TaxID=3028298 RepID=A0AA96ZX35_9EURY|nr:hypothetical protein MsAm2_03890 [Methanosarcinaceae archaeon Am2]
MNNEDFILKWKLFNPDEKSEIRIDSTHPLDIYIGYNDFKEKKFLLIFESKKHPPLLKNTQILEINTGQRRSDNRWTWTLTLKKKEYEYIFMKLCWDLIESTRHNDVDSGSIDLIFRFKKWQNLLENVNDNLLSEKVIKGLIGELIFLKDFALKKYDSNTALDGWTGSLGRDKDFQYPDYWVEVKSISSGKNEVCISSLEQLDSSDEGKLIVFFIDNSTQNDRKGFTLHDIVQNIRNDLQNEIGALSSFEMKLAAVGNIEQEEYKRKYYSLTGLREYCVDNSFPKIGRNDVFSEITKVSYAISLPAIENKITHIFVK